MKNWIVLLLALVVTTGCNQKAKTGETVAPDGHLPILPFVVTIVDGQNQTAVVFTNDAEGSLTVEDKVNNQTAQAKLHPDGTLEVEGQPSTLVLHPDGSITTDGQKLPSVIDQEGVLKVDGAPRLRRQGGELVGVDEKKALFQDGARVLVEGDEKATRAMLYVVSVYLTGVQE